jgi:hypothetical protein
MHARRIASIIIAKESVLSLEIPSSNPRQKVHCELLPKLHCNQHVVNILRLVSEGQSAAFYDTICIRSWC